MRDFQKLEIWTSSRELAKSIYYLTKTLPVEERFGLTSQIRRCAISIPANIAEGSAKFSEKDFARFLEISLGSCFELRSHLLLCGDVNLLSEETINPVINLIKVIEKRISSLIIIINRNIK